MAALAREPSAAAFGAVADSEIRTVPQCACRAAGSGPGPAKAGHPVLQVRSDHGAGLTAIRSRTAASFRPSISTIFRGDEPPDTILITEAGDNERGRQEFLNGLVCATSLGRRADAHLQRFTHPAHDLVPGRAGNDLDGKSGHAGMLAPTTAPARSGSPRRRPLP